MIELSGNQKDIVNGGTGLLAIPAGIGLVAGAAGTALFGSATLLCIAIPLLWPASIAMGAGLLLAGSITVVSGIGLVASLLLPIL